MTTSNYEGFSRQDLLDRLGALGEEYIDLQNQRRAVQEEMKMIETLLELDDKS